MTMDKNKKIGLALGAGGAKGAAHIGALKAFHEEGIEFDIVSGCSIGSIVGALYAKGLDHEDMLRLVEEMSGGNAASLFAASFLFGDGLVGAVRNILGGADFSDLKKPFAAVAVDAATGKEEVFMGENGNLSLACAASSSVPPTFPPIYSGKRILVDGAFLNYIPSDLCRAMGAEKVVGVNLGAGRDNNFDLKAVLDDVLPENKVPRANRSKKGYDNSDIMIEPDLRAYSGSSVNSFYEMYEIGYNAVKGKIKDIIEVLR